MKFGTTNLVLTCVLAVLLLAGVLFALQTIFRTRELRSLQSLSLEHQQNAARVNLLFTEAEQYSKTHPDLSPILKPFEGKPTAR